MAVTKLKLKAEWLDARAQVRIPGGSGTTGNAPQQRRHDVRGDRRCLALAVKRLGNAKPKHGKCVASATVHSRGSIRPYRRYRAGSNRWTFLGSNRWTKRGRIRTAFSQFRAHLWPSRQYADAPRRQDRESACRRQGGGALPRCVARWPPNQRIKSTTVRYRPVPDGVGWCQFPLVSAG